MIMMIKPFCVIVELCIMYVRRQEENTEHVNERRLFNRGWFCSRTSSVAVFIPVPVEVDFNVSRVT